MSYSGRTKQNTTWQLLFASVLCVCCLYQIWATEATASNGQIWLDGILGFLHNYPFIPKIITSVFLLLNTLSLVLILRRFSLIELRNYAPALLYLLFVFVFPQMINLWSMLIGFFIITGILPQLFEIDDNNLHSKTFMFGLWCGILAVIDFYFIFLLLLIYPICLFSRKISFRSIILPIVGVSVAFIYLFSIFYLTDNYVLMHSFIDFIQGKFILAPLERSLENSESHFFISFLITTILSIAALYKILSKVSTVVIHRRRKYFTLSFLFFSFIALLIFCRSSMSLFLPVLLMLCTMIVCVAMSHGKRNLFYKAIFILLFCLKWLQIITLAFNA